MFICQIVRQQTWIYRMDLWSSLLKIGLRRDLINQSETTLLSFVSFGRVEDLEFLSESYWKKKGRAIMSATLLSVFMYNAQDLERKTCSRCLNINIAQVRHFSAGWWCLEKPCNCFLTVSSSKSPSFSSSLLKSVIWIEENTLIVSLYLWPISFCVWELAMCSFAYSAGDCCHVRFSCVWKHICEGLLLSGGLSLLIPLLSSSSQVFPFVKNLSHHPSEPKLFQIQYVLPTISLFFCHQFFYSRASYACAETSPHTSHQILCHGRCES